MISLPSENNMLNACSSREQTVCSTFFPAGDQNIFHNLNVPRILRILHTYNFLFDLQKKTFWLICVPVRNVTEAGKNICSFSVLRNLLHNGLTSSQTICQYHRMLSSASLLNYIQTDWCQYFCKLLHFLNFTF